MRLLVILFLLLAPLPALGQEGDASPASVSQSVLSPDLGQRIAADYAEPATAGFVSATVSLRSGLGDLCAAPSQAALAAARDAFVDTVAAWGRVSVLRFGPLVTDNRFETIFFWPDPRGVTLRQVQEVLASGDETVTDSAQLAGKSVAMQGLLALDYLLAGTGAEALGEGGDMHRCAYATAAADVLATQADAIAEGWAAETAFGASFRNPGNGGYYRTTAEVAGELVKALLTSVDFVRSAELLPAMGESAEEARGRRAPFWRSNLTFTLVEAQLSGLNDLLAASGLAETLTGARATPYTNLSTDLRQAGRIVATLGQPAEMAFADPDDRRRLDYIMLTLGFASQTIGGDLTAALNLTMGFNALDGD